LFTSNITSSIPRPITPLSARPATSSGASSKKTAAAALSAQRLRWALCEHRTSVLARASANPESLPDTRTFMASLRQPSLRAYRQNNVGAKATATRIPSRYMDLSEQIKEIDLELAALDRAEELKVNDWTVPRNGDGECACRYEPVPGRQNPVFKRWNY
jgi:hypothetical protein